jgi:hypothetical protein
MIKLITIILSIPLMAIMSGITAKSLVLEVWADIVRAVRSHLVGICRVKKTCMMQVPFPLKARGPKMIIKLRTIPSREDEVHPQQMTIPISELTATHLQWECNHHRQASAVFSVTRDYQIQRDTGIHSHIVQTTFPPLILPHPILLANEDRVSIDTIPELTIALLMATTQSIIKHISRIGTQDIAPSVRSEITIDNLLGDRRPLLQKRVKDLEIQTSIVQTKTESLAPHNHNCNLQYGMLDHRDHSLEDAELARPKPLPKLPNEAMMICQTVSSHFVMVEFMETGAHLLMMKS